MNVKENKYETLMTSDCVDQKMEDISKVWLEPLTKSQFLCPKTVVYKQNGVSKTTDCVKEHSDVEVLIFNVTRNVLVFVKQFRPAVYLADTQTETQGSQEIINTEKWSSKYGFTIELCAGIVDKDGPLEKIAQEEVLEECGYEVPMASLKKITSFRNGTTLNGANITLFYAEVTDAQKVGPGGGLAQEGELIQVLELSLEESKQLLDSDDVNSEPTLLVGLFWFFNNVGTERTKK